MPALLKTALTCNITWMGFVPDRDASLRSVAVSEAQATFAGFEGEAHGGAMRASCSRVKSQHPRGTQIRNVRQFCVMSVEELAQIAAAADLDHLPPEWMGASIVVEGLPDFTHVPPSSRLQNAAGTTLVVDMENRPCHLPGLEMEDTAAAKKLKAAAKHKRGITAWVEREGPLAVGDTLTLNIPDQPVWSHLDRARGLT
ncbi:MOSC domain-containing protein [Nereida sp. MMG025]|uniref:MOSC domain-containing protein n=1 Tax=Nereida sp. MMG025 TaxID=2909981 RepID=UPI001F15FF91|nr:MOSC domain-containing protein [Nereida sp. MMG025]MCF6444986.1 MOSC domain-containing protein [Nereida sp. MMG025]